VTDGRPIQVVTAIDMVCGAVVLISRHGRRLAATAWGRSLSRAPGAATASGERRAASADRVEVIA
jgi:hypothetical protein